MKILIVGNGGREHAIAWKLRRDAPAAQLFITRGNGGTRELATHIPLDPSDRPAWSGWAQANSIDLTVVGPEGPLAAGIVDHFSAAGLPIFGPTRGAASLESSKAFAKSVMKEAGIPTAGFAAFTDATGAERYIRERGAPLVVKASGLAAGKGAVVCLDTEEAVATALEMLTGQTFGDAGREVVIEDFMVGEELSVLAITDGAIALPLLPAQDHKRIGEGDTGPNTGGMGAYAPVSIATPALLERVQREILEPTLAAMKARGRGFCGVLYAGLMITDDGPKVVEFNCRFGDPETQVVLPLLRSSLLEPMLAVARGETLSGVTLELSDRAAVTTVLAAAGYPGTPEIGQPIDIPSNLAKDDDVLVFHAGTREENGRLLTNGGRVVTVTGLAPTMPDAAARSRAAADVIRFEGKQYRRDIGWREMQRVTGA